MIRLDSHPALRRWQGTSLAIGLIAALISALGAFLAPFQFFTSYLVAFLFWLSISLGGLSVVMLRHLVGGRWGVAIQRPLEATSRLIPLLAILFLPILLGTSWLYAWAKPALSANDPFWQHLLPYLNLPAFTIRLVLYFAVWLILAFFLNRWSLQPHAGVRLRALSGPGLLLYGLSISFAAIDWVMTLHPHWYSSIYGCFFLVSQSLSAFAFATIAAALLGGQEEYRELLSPSVFQDLGNLMLTFVLFWAYIHASQLIIVWSGNLPQEISWYAMRTQGDWQGYTAFMAIGEFAIPFLLLLFRAIKRHPARLAGLAAGILAMRFLDLYWHVMPAFFPLAWSIHWLNLTCFLAIGGIWMTLYLKELANRPLVPPPEPRIEEVPVHG